MIVADDVRVEFRRGLLRGKVRALNGLSLEVRDGDFFALVGQNGAGKSTAMYCFLGLMKPTSGKIEVMGRVPELGSPLNAGVAYLPEEPHYHLYLTVEEATRYYASLYGKRVSDKAIHEALDRLGLAQFKSLPLSKCSKGMKQKVGIAQCLIHETRLLFLDEPTRGLDPLIVREFRETLRELHQRGATIVMNTHVLSEIEMLANRVAIVDGGKVIAQDDLRNFLTTDRELYSVTFEANGSVPEYLGSAQRSGNLVTGNIPKERLYDFMEFARISGLSVHECSLKKTSLEDSFFKIVKGTGSGA
ncbi:MAG TPA: ABC transporter ATP-binding protein [Candidatus Sulfotelmatobacter sp.]|nr:ABC transporter ATP-binding protein [Candidatus Sulfotelmatobacter sp.]